MKYEKFEIGEGLSNDDKIYRYINLNQLMHMVEMNATYLTRLISWEDTWEVPNSKLPTLNNEGKLEYPLYSSSSDLFGQCWSLKEESDAMWRIYSPLKEGIKIGTSIGKLKMIKGLEYSYINKVYYYRDLSDGLKEIRNKHPFQEGLIKRDAFEHEKEVRLITLNNKKIIGDKDNKSNYIEFSVDVKVLIEEIVVDPRCKDYYFSII